MMESVVIVLFVFGCIAVGFAIYRAKRGGRATKQPGDVPRQSPGLTETVRRLYAMETAEETVPDANRISPKQRDFVRTHVDEFVSLHREEMEEMVDDALARFRAKRESAGEQLNEEELEKAEKSIRVIMANRFAKAWCELRGVA
jgi:hypothetical protein